MLWIIYWLVMFLFIVISSISILKVNKLIGIINLVLAIIMPVWNFVFALNRNYFEVSEISNFINKLSSGNIEAIFILIFNILLFGLSIYNGYNIIKNTKK